MSSAKKLGENLRKLRLKKNMSQVDLANALSVDRAYISNIENGRMNPTLSTLEKIAGALEISSSEPMMKMGMAAAAKIATNPIIE
jgi:transcriptional regulator with XRE-family HTH domain